MLDHNPIPSTIYISGSGFPVMFHGVASHADDCSQKQVVYSLLTESFDSVRGTLFYNTEEAFKERFSPISTFDPERKTFRRRVILLVLGSRFNTFGMFANDEHNLSLVREFMKREYQPVRITNMTRDIEFPRYYTDDECKEGWLENLTLRAYGDQKQFHVLSADLVTDQLEDEYVVQFFPRDDKGRFVVPARYITSIQVETEEQHADDGRVMIKRLHNAFGLV